MGRVAVIGAGFRGFCDALSLQEAGHNVTIIDSVPFFGGIMNSMQMGDFIVDKGVHFFNSMPPEIIDIVTEIMDGKVRPIGYWSRSVFGQEVTENFSLPNLECISQEEKNKIIFELIELASEGKADLEMGNLQEYFDRNFGNTIGTIYARIFEGIYKTKAQDAEKRAVKQTSLHRTKFLSDEQMMLLKNIPWLNDRLAARRKALGKIDDLTSVYPSDGKGMKGWCERAATWLRSRGVNIHLGTKIERIELKESNIIISMLDDHYEFDRVVWSNDEIDQFTRMFGWETDVNDLLKGTPLVFYSMVTDIDKIKEFTYHQNFDPDSSMFRAAAAGYYGNQVNKEGKSFITIECTAEMDGDVWNNPASQIDAIWAECKRDNVVDNSAQLLECNFIKIPTSYKIRLNGYNDKFIDVCNRVDELDKRLILRKSEPFFRREIYLESLNLPDLVG
ncbi:MAG: FAD-dependent oxidoreductase [Pseudomonadota bacterium]